MDKTYNLLVKSGLATPPREVPLFTDEPKFYNYFCIPSGGAKNKYLVDDIFGQGFDPNRGKSKLKSIAEMLERLCLSNPSVDFTTSHFIKNKHFIQPSIFFCYSEEQIPNLDKKKNELDKGNYQWMEVKKIPEEKDFYIPAQMVYLSKSFGREYWLRKEQISTGAALGKKGDNRAFKTGFLESVERDAIMSFYLKKVSGRKMYSFPKKIQNLISYLNRYQLETHIFDITTDLCIPSVLALTLDYTGLGEAVNVGSSSGLSFEKAIEKSILESIQCRRIGRASKKFIEAEPIDETKINSLEARLIYWRDLDRIEHVRHLIEEKPQVSFQKLPHKRISLNSAIQKLTEKKFNVLVADITLPEIKKIGFEVLKVVIPELHPLYLDERAKSLYSIHHGTIKNDPTLKPHPVT
jgi:ribosomal protein S12 methylthiotransferase accessory factor